jgi:hypothetical protein
LRRFGFIPTGTKMAGFDIPILELDQRKGWFIPTVIAMLQTRLVDGNKAFKHLRDEWES